MSKLHPFSSLLVGDIAAFSKPVNTCNRLMYDMGYYTFIIMTLLIGILFLLDFTVFIYKRCHPIKEEGEEDDDETVRK